MAGTNPNLVVADAGPLIHLDELNSLDILADFGTVLVARQVWDEVVRHRRGLMPESIPGVRIVDVESAASAELPGLVASLDLDAGETAALTLMESQPATMLLCDDAAARLAAESLGFAVHGTVGVLVRSIRQGSRTRMQVLDTLRSLPHRSTLHIAGRLLARIIAQVEQGAG